VIFYYEVNWIKKLMKDSFDLHFNFGNEIFVPELKGGKFERSFWRFAWEFDGEVDEKRLLVGIEDRGRLRGRLLKMWWKF
jgi:hypothetical protein